MSSKSVIWIVKKINLNWFDYNGIIAMGTTLPEYHDEWVADMLGGFLMGIKVELKAHVQDLGEEKVKV